MSKSRRKRFSVDDLFTDTSPRSVGVTDLVEAKQVRLDRIEPDPNQPRREFDDDALDELAASIRAEGVLQPIAVRYDEERDVYVILHGERRWRAARRAGLTAIPAILRDVPEERRLLQQLMENIVREDLNALDRAAALRALKAQMDDAPWERVAEAVGIRRSRLFQLLGTEKLSPAFQDALRQGVISEKQTRSVQPLDPEIQEELGARLMTGELAAANIDAIARSLRRATSVDEARAALDSHQRSPADEAGRSARAARRQARSLSRTLEALDPAALSPRTLQSLHADLQGAAERIARFLDESR